MSEPKTIYLKDYKKPDYYIEKIDLYFNIFDDKTLVTATTVVKKNSELKMSVPLVLQGDHLKLHSVKVNGNTFHYEQKEDGLVLTDVPENFSMEIVTEIYPHLNTALEGLYQSGSMFCTQNEPEGFRRITYYVDRPDNMAKFSTTIEANKKKYPYLLSNGNKIESKDVEGERHRVKWEDPFKKPSYLFALVAGDFDVLQDIYKTTSGRNVKLEIFVDKGNLDKSHHAMDSLKKSMKWDEDTYGLEYDLDIYMIVAVSSFNMGAMENKGLNIFNSALVLAKQETATDMDFETIEGVIGHEYFHNWTGNRVTCRDWFQLTLKEGLTVFRDQEFSADMSSRGLNRISNVNRLRNLQFPEDAGPTSHPIKPSSYIEINNFYTATVYEKGAEIIRMIQTMIGKDKFRQGMDKYFELFDGQAVTTEDFVKAMEIASGKDFTQFKLWYHQNRTPVLSVNEKYDPTHKTYALTIEQSPVEPMQMPLRVALYDEQGKFLQQEEILDYKDQKQIFLFNNITSRPVLSLNRDFSAPVKINYEQSLNDLLNLYANDTDAFNRYEAGQKIMQKIIFDGLTNKSADVPKDFIEAMRKVLVDTKIDSAFKGELITPPSETELNDLLKSPDYENIFNVRNSFALAVGHALKNELMKVYDENNQAKKFSLDQKSVGERTLKNRILWYLSFVNDSGFNKMLMNQFKTATNMTDEFSALQLFCHLQNDETKLVTEQFYSKWKNESLVIDKWFAAQASCRGNNTLTRVNELLKHPDFTMKVPNRYRSLVYSFARNLRNFHDISGSGYDFIAKQVIEIDQLNPQVAARLANSSFNVFKRLDRERYSLMKGKLDLIMKADKISRDTYEIVSKNLN